MLPWFKLFPSSNNFHGILVTLVVWFCFCFFCLAHLVLQNVNKDYVIFSYFVTSLPKVTKNQKQKMGWTNQKLWSKNNWWNCNIWKKLPFNGWVGFEFLMRIEFCWDWDGMYDGFWLARIRLNVTDFCGLGFSKCLSKQNKEDF